MTGCEQDDGEIQPLLSSGSVTPKKRSSISVNVEAVESDGLLTDGHAGYGATADVRSPISNELSSNEVTEAVKSANVTMSKIVLPLTIGIFLAAMDGTIVASTYASIGSDMNQLQTTSWIATGYMLAMTSFQPLYGKLCDIFGRKSCLIFAYSVFALGSFLCGLARNMPQLIAARALAGLGGGGMTTVVSILVSDIVPLRGRGTWNGIFNIFFACGSTTGAPLGGILADSIGWRWAFFVQVPFALFAILVVSISLNLPTTPFSDLRSKLRRVDFLGTALLVLAVFALLLALDRGGNIAWIDLITGTCIAVSLILFAAFAFVELKPNSKNQGALASKPAREPFAPRRILLSPSLFAAYVCNFFALASVLCMLFHAALYFQAVAHQSAAQAGLGLLPAVAGGVVGSLAGGMIMQRTGRYWWLTMGVLSADLLGTLGVLIVTVVSQSFGTWTAIGVASGLAVMAFGNSAAITTTLVALIANAAPEDQAIVTAVSYLFRSLGSVIGISGGSTLVQNRLRILLRSRLAGLDLDVDKIARSVRSSLASLDDLEPALRAIVRASYEDAVQASFALSAVFAVAALVSAFFIKEKSLTR